MTQKTYCRYELVLDDQFDLRKSAKFIENHIRITHTDQPLDTLSFSLEALSNPEFLLENFWHCSWRCFFKEDPSKLYSGRLFDEMPDWFKVTQFFLLAEWIVVHFEIHLARCYNSLKKDDIVRDSQRLHLEEYDSIWKGLGKKRKHKLLQTVLEVFGALPANFFNYQNTLNQNSNIETDTRKIMMRILHQF